MTDALSAAIESILRTDDLSEEIHQAQINTLRGAYEAALAQPQEPVAWRFKPMIGCPWSLSDDGYYISCKRDQGYFVEPLYTAPPQRKPLTEEEIQAAWDSVDMRHPRGNETRIAFARAIERAHEIKENT